MSNLFRKTHTHTQTHRGLAKTITIITVVITLVYALASPESEFYLLRVYEFSSRVRFEVNVVQEKNVAVIDEFHIVDLMEIHVKNLS